MVIISTILKRLVREATDAKTIRLSAAANAVTIVTNPDFGLSNESTEHNQLFQDLVFQMRSLLFSAKYVHQFVKARGYFY